MKSSKAFCIDIGGTRIKSAVVKNKRMANYTEFSTPKGKSELLALLREIVKTRPRSSGKVCIAVASPLRNGIIANPPNLPLSDFNLASYMKRTAKSRIFIENDIKCVALAEHTFGVKKGNFVVLSLGTGIGGGIFIDGEQYLGRGCAGELGHIIIRGKYLEDLWKNTRARIRSNNYGKLLTIDELLTSNSPAMVDIREDMLDYLAQAITTITSSFDPEYIILSGGIRQSAYELISALKKRVRRYAFLPLPQLRWSSSQHPELLGASLLPQLKN